MNLVTMLETPPENPLLTVQLKNWLRSWYGLEADLTPMAGYDDLNFRVSLSSGERFVLKLNTNLQAEAYLMAETMVLVELKGGQPGSAIYPEVIPRTDGTYLTKAILATGQACVVRLLTFLEGTFYAEASPSLVRDHHFGRFLAQLHLRLAELEQPAIRARHIIWDLQNALELKRDLATVPDPAHRRLAAYFLMQLEFEAMPILNQLPKQLLHNDANNWNVLTHGEKVSGIIDFGDLVYAPPIQEVAIALAYVMMDREDPLEAAKQLLSGYQEVLPLTQEAIGILHCLIAARLCTTAIAAAKARQEGNRSAYVSISEAAAWRLLTFLHQTSPEKAKQLWTQSTPDKEIPIRLLNERLKLFSKAMSISYQEPLHMEKAALQYMYDSQGKDYLDCVNNIMHVGHCHPKVAQAAQKQLPQLNTNTRYLYPALTDYAKKLLSYFPASLNKVFFVNSGSAAADLALRLARAHTGREAMLVMEHGYHGNTAATIEVSHYKYGGKGGSSRKPWIFQAPLPMYAQTVPKVEVAQWIDEPVAGFISESIVGCGGQVVFPDGYLNAIYAQVKAQGGVCIADEVQTGFGRVGDHFWAYELYNVLPDIVVMGKPMGNGHPLAAVVTTEKIAQSFETGMEFFSSFGGNPISCAIGEAVLEVIEEEQLQENAKQVGTWLKTELQQLQFDFPSISDVRGAGLFLGIELVDSKSGQASEALATALVNELKEKGILLSVDGPFHNVVKIKPPLVFNLQNAERLVAEIGKFLAQWNPS